MFYAEGYKSEIPNLKSEMIMLNAIDLDKRQKSKNLINL